MGSGGRQVVHCAGFHQSLLLCTGGKLETEAVTHLPVRRARIGSVSLVSIDPDGSHDYPSRDPRALASGGLSLLLAVEITETGRAPANRSGPAHADPANEHREPALGIAAHSRRIAQARLR